MRTEPHRITFRYADGHSHTSIAHVGAELYRTPNAGALDAWRRWHPDAPLTLIEVDDEVMWVSVEHWSRTLDTAERVNRDNERLERDLRRLGQDFDAVKAANRDVVRELDRARDCINAIEAALVDRVGVFVGHIRGVIDDYRAGHPMAPDPVEPDHWSGTQANVNSDTFEIVPELELPANSTYPYNDIIDWTPDVNARGLSFALTSIHEQLCVLAELLRISIREARS